MTLGSCTKIYPIRQSKLEGVLNFRQEIVKGKHEPFTHVDREDYT
jgi:hypothetical protein